MNIAAKDLNGMGRNSRIPHYEVPPGKAVPLCASAGLDRSDPV